MSIKNDIICLQVSPRFFAWYIFVYTNEDDYKNLDIKILIIGRDTLFLHYITNSMYMIPKICVDCFQIVTAFKSDTLITARS